jgi:hypothetical protein
MLDALSDFWKPSKKTQGDKLRADQLQIGSAIVFGFVPQASLSGRRLQVSAVNTYQFGSEALTSFVLTQDRDPGISMIIAESEGEQYLALSRRITVSDRIKMFDSSELDNVIEKADATQLACKDNPDFKGWTVSSYRREIQGMKGFLYTGDFRKTPLPSAAAAQEFKYVLLASESNEHAIEIEKYADGRIEMYATVYRRTSDISEVSQPARPDIKLATPIASSEEKPAAVKSEPKMEPVKLQEFSAPPVVTAAPVKTPEAAKPFKATAPVTPTQPPEEKKPMSPQPQAAETRNFSTNGSSPKMSNMQAANQSQPKQENKPVNKANGLETNDAVECDLRVANKIIDEAIRNEMRLSDVVRRVIELPVSHQEAVQIPITLSDDDYSLLAIRYGISASDRVAIKARIIEDLNGFSGLGKK